MDVSGDSCSSWSDGCVCMCGEDVPVLSEGMMVMDGCLFATKVQYFDGLLAVLFCWCFGDERMPWSPLPGDVGDGAVLRGMMRSGV